LITVDFAVFYLTAFGQVFAGLISEVIKLLTAMPLDLGPLVALVTYGLFALMGSLLYILGESARVAVLSVFSFMAFLPSALTFTSASWLFGVSSQTISFWSTQFFFTVIAGAVIVFCLILLNYFTKNKTLKAELISRGGTCSDVNSALATNINFASIIAIIALGLGVVALVVFMVAQPLSEDLIKITPYATFLFGFGAGAVFSVLIYYFFSHDR
jgi:hypothetical protein